MGVLNTEGCARLERHDSGRRHTGDALCAINELTRNHKATRPVTRRPRSFRRRHGDKQRARVQNRRDDGRQVYKIGNAGPAPDAARHEQPIAGGDQHTKSEKWFEDVVVDE